MEKQYAVTIKKKSLDAISDLDAIIVDIQGRCTDEEFERVRRGVGLSIAQIIDMILEPVYSEFPDLEEDRNG